MSDVVIDLVSLVAVIGSICVVIAVPVFIVFAWRSLVRISREVTEISEHMKVIEDDVARVAAGRVGGPSDEAHAD